MRKTLKFDVFIFYQNCDYFTCVFPTDRMPSKSRISHQPNEFINTVAANQDKYLQNENHSDELKEK